MYTYIYIYTYTLSIYFPNRYSYKCRYIQSTAYININHPSSQRMNGNGGCGGTPLSTSIIVGERVVQVVSVLKCES